jgi:O-antigen ligase
LFLVFVGLELFTGHSFLDDTLARSADTFSVENQTTTRRIDKIIINYYILKKNPIFGIGYNRENIKDLLISSEIIKNIDNIDKREEIDVLMPHNFVMHSLSHTGIIGTLILSIIIALAYKGSYVLLRSNDSQSSYGLFMICSFTFFLIFALMNTTFKSEGWIFWFLCGTSFIYNKKSDG